MYSGHRMTMRSLGETSMQLVYCPYKKGKLGQRHTQQEDGVIPTERMPWGHEDGRPQTKDRCPDHMLHS